MVALRIALDQLRARRREVLYQPEDLEREIDRAEREVDGSRGDAATASREDAEDARARLDRALEKLNPRYKLAIVRRVIEEKTREDAARELNVTVATFDVVLHRAMTALRKELDIASKAGEP
jgi:RNA polymerase sigma-70 factor (ECF subfamily)